MNESNPTLVLPPGPVARALSELRRYVTNDPNELLLDHYLSRGNGMLLVGPTGIGKSSFTMQCMLSWALNRAVFQIGPKQPLVSLLIQAENDDGELANMRDGVIAGMGLGVDEADEAMSRIWVHQETSTAGQEFFDHIVRRLLIRHRPDVLWIDPALAYIGGAMNAQEDVGAFVRTGLQPLLQEFQCGGVVIHHTNKNTGQVNRGKVANPASQAYAGAGSAEWANWARRTLVIEPTNAKHLFQLHAAKGGMRLKWDDGDGNRVIVKIIAHSKKPDEIYWRTATDEEEQLIGKPLAISRAPEVLDLIPNDGAEDKLAFEERAKKTLGMGDKALENAIKSLFADEKAYRWEQSRPGGGPHHVLISRHRQPADQIPLSQKKRRELKKQTKKAKVSSSSAAGKLDDNNNNQTD